MRGFAIAVLSSLVVHGAALAWFAADEDAEAVAVAVAVETTPPQQEVPRELEVTFFTFDAPPAGDEIVAKPARIATTGGMHGMGRARGRDKTTTPDARGDVRGTANGGERSPYMTMRKPGSDVVRGMSGSFLDKFLENSKPIPPPPDIPGERANDQIAGVRAKLKRAWRYSPDELAALRGELEALKHERDNEELKADGGGTYRTEKETFRGLVAADGSMKLEDKRENMDTQDKLMLEHGIDPYAKAKLDYLDRTRDQRVAVGKRWREEQLKKSVIYMQQHIARLFATTSDAARIKEGMFELWDECIETGTPEQIAGGEAARAFVMSVIRANVRYTPDELRALNARRQSKQDFAP